MFALADCNNFYASCERVFRPDLVGRPVIVLSSNDGCAIARSNEAKALGIKMGDPYFKIKDIVERNNVAVFSGNMALYGDMSQRVRWVLEEFAPSIEAYSIDEAFLDLRGMDGADFDALAKSISARCWRMTSIPVSVGIAPTKTLAKIASKLCKSYPKLRGGCYMHRAQDIEKVLSTYPVEDVWGIGRRSAKKLKEYNIYTALDFRSMSEGVVRNMMGITGVRIWRELHGEACIEFEHTIEARQSIGVSRSFSHEIYEPRELAEQVANFAASAAEKLRAQHSACLEMMVYAYTNRFREDAPQTYGSTIVTFPEGTDDHRAIIAASTNALRDLYKRGFGYKKAGVVLTKLIPKSGVVGSLFAERDMAERDERLSAAIDAIRHTHGRGMLRLGAQGSGAVISAHKMQSPHYTTLWSDLPKVTVK